MIQVVKYLVAPIASLLLLSSCSLVMSDDQAGEIYLSAVCPANLSADAIVDAAQGGDIEKFKLAVTDQISDLENQIGILRDYEEKFPEDLRQTIASFNELTAVQIQALWSSLRGSTVPEADRLFGEYLERVDKTSILDDIGLLATQIRLELGLSTDREATCLTVIED